MKQIQRFLPKQLLVKLFSGIATLLVLMPIGLSTPHPKPVYAASNLSWLHTEGNKILDESGKQVIFRGVNIESWNWEYKKNLGISFEARAIPKVTGSPLNDGWGANVVLLAIASGPVNRNDTKYLGLLDQMVTLAKNNGARTLVVYRSAEPNSDQVNMPDQAAENAMATLAKRYTNEPSVLYGLQVEPHDVSWSTLKPRFTSMIDAIRANNPKSLIAVPGTNWGRYVHWALTDPINRSNLVYKVHYYDPFSVVDTNYKLDSVASKLPVMLGEFGAGSQTTLPDVAKLLDYSEARSISWIGWIFQKDGCPCMLADVNTFAPTPFGEEVKKRIQAAALASVPSVTQPVVPVQVSVSVPPLVQQPVAPVQSNPATSVSPKQETAVQQPIPQQPVNQAQVSAILDAAPETLNSSLVSAEQLAYFRQRAENDALSFSSSQSGSQVSQPKPESSSITESALSPEIGTTAPSVQNEQKLSDTNSQAKANPSSIINDSGMSGKAIANIITLVTVAAIALLISISGAFVAMNVYRKRVRQTS